MAITATMRVLTSTLCLLTATTAFAQSTPEWQPFSADAGRINPTRGTIRKAAREAVVRLPLSNTVSPQPSPAALIGFAIDKVRKR